MRELRSVMPTRPSARGGPLLGLFTCGLACALTCGLAGCSKTTSPLPDKNTNWLSVCDEGDACGAGFECLCGVCTRTCDALSDCPTSAADVACLDTSAPSTADRCVPTSQVPEKLCGVVCDDDASCQAALGANASCREGLCERAPAPPPASESGEPSTPEAALLQFEAFVATQGSCQANTDCTIISPGCPIPCFVPVAREAASDAEERAQQVRQRYAQDGRSCTYRCAFKPAVACVAGRCELVEGEPDACESNSDCGWGEIDREIQESSDCMCLYGCPYLPLSQATIARRMADHDRLCQSFEDGEGNPCGIDDCTTPGEIRCIEGRCSGDF